MTAETKEIRVGYAYEVTCYGTRFLDVPVSATPDEIEAAVRADFEKDWTRYMAGTPEFDTACGYRVTYTETDDAPGEREEIHPDGFALPLGGEGRYVWADGDGHEALMYAAARLVDVLPNADAPAELVRRVNAYPALVSALHACLAELRAELANDPDATLIAAAVEEAEAALTAAGEG